MFAVRPPPSVFDAHVNGYTVLHAGGRAEVIDFSQPNLTLDQVRAASETLISAGTSFFLATIVTAPIDDILHNLRILAQAMEEPWGKSIAGIHIEGIFFSPSCKGAHPVQYIRPFADVELYKQMLDAACGKIALMTVAPSISDAPKLIEAAVNEGVTVSVGHHDATPAQLRAAFRAGATAVTHAGNGWLKDADAEWRKRPELLAHLAEQDVYVMIIPDGVHVPLEFIHYVAKIVEACRPGHTVLVSDLSPLANAPAGEYQIYSGLKVKMNDERLGARRGSQLSGSYQTLPQSLEWLADQHLSDLTPVLPPELLTSAVSKNPIRMVSNSLKRIGTYPRLEAWVSESIA